MSEQESNEHGWIVTVSAVERSFGRHKERLVRIPSRRVDRVEAEREAAYRFRNDVESWAELESVEIAGSVRLIPGPRTAED